ncbi:hypothetical protein HPB48_008947 [Haemaphysalis longicornis]|uniref:BPTI/Kunitz inhibitor domain-containing protein n=1 Tax=Haemaphysalis longicornis TaxID=44386 RepID=A0A9J6FSU8_HAELO|nr:hypothetical protein HPB48_008947 [Haemaphysalis longicornis]
MTEVTSDVIEEEDVSTATHVLHNPERPRPKSRQCGDHFFSLCPESKQEFYFRASQRACLHADTHNVVAVCNRGPNRFSSRESCTDACGGGDSETDEPECSGGVVFAECRAEDVTGVQWFFDGERCRAWSFHRGLCPGNGSSAFPTRRQCRKACLKPGSRRNPCAVPRAEVCSPDVLKYPFFADMSAARAQDRCMAATPKNLLGRQCLNGNNRFVSQEDCGRACLEGVQ